MYLLTNLWRTFVIVLYLNQSKSVKCIDGNYKTRQDWGAQQPSQIIPIKTPVPFAIISHTATPMCYTFPKCAQRVRQIQAFHMQFFHDIGYNFLIGADGNIYEGHGWDTANFHMGHNNDSIGISFIGNFMFDKLTPEMINAASAVLNDGVKLGKLKKDYKILAHNQIVDTLSPGTNVIKVISTWPHFDNDVDVR